MALKNPCFEKIFCVAGKILKKGPKKEFIGTFGARSNPKSTYIGTEGTEIVVLVSQKWSSQNTVKGTL